MDSPAPARREAVLRDQDRRFRRLLSRVWEGSAFYREYYTDHGIREHQLGDLTVADLPFLTKQTLMENFDRAVTDPRLRKAPIERWIARVRDPARLYQEDLIVLHGSGSSGTFGIFVYGRTDWNVMNGVMASRLPPPENYPDKTRLAYVCLTRGHSGGVSSALQLRATYDVLIVSALDPPERMMDQLERFQPQRLTGYSSGIARLAEAALEGTLHIRPKRIVAVGDLLTPPMEQKIRQAWGAPILNHYGAAESLFLAVRGDGDEAMTLMDDLNVLEVLDGRDRPVPPGGTGRVVITNLFNYTLPLLRYEMGDVVVQGDTLASGFGSIRHVWGVAHDALPLDVDGRQVELPPVALRSFYAPGIEGIQFIARDGGVEVTYVAQRDLDREVRDEFDKLLAVTGGSGARFTVRRVPFIAADPRTAKVRLVVLDRAPPALPPAEVPDDPTSAERDASEPAAFAKREIEGSLVARFERQVERHGDQVAVKSRDGVVTYGELDRAANRIAQILLARNGERMDPVALLTRPGLAAVTAILGILKAGKFYVPLDPAFPPMRLASILQDTEPRTLLTDSAHLAVATALAGGDREVINIEALEPHSPDDNPRLKIASQSYSYLMYTSGSTGGPKGVIHTHRSVLHQIAAYVRVISPRPDDRMTFLHSHCFGASRLDIFGALLNGAAMVHLDVASEGLGRVAEWLREEEVTILHWLPTAFRHVAGGLDGSQEFPRLRWIMLGSEPLLAGDADLFRRHFAGGCRLLNRYGTTETGTISFQVVDDTTRFERGTAPIGHPIEDVDVLVLDGSGTEVESGEIGEIAVRSAYLAVGYWRRPELNRRAFRADALTGRPMYLTGDLGRLLLDGSLVHVGRQDSQRKIRGHRVELGETEAVLLAHAAIREAAVAVDEGSGSDRLVAYLTAHDGIRPTGSALRTYLKARLPAPMLPSAFIWLDALPLNANGKLDRLALPNSRGTSADLDPAGSEPRTPTEQALAVAWREVLGLDRTGVDDNFFDLGGHSLLATQVQSRISDIFGVKLDIRDLFESPTIAGIAKVIESQRGGRLP